MERFVWYVTVGGVAVVAGLWIGRLFDGGSAPWLVGVLLAILGVIGLGIGIESEIEV